MHWSRVSYFSSGPTPPQRTSRSQRATEISLTPFRVLGLVAGSARSEEAGRMAGSRSVAFEQAMPNANEAARAVRAKCDDFIDSLLLSLVLLRSRRIATARQSVAAQKRYGANARCAPSRY